MLQSLAKFWWGTNWHHHFQRGPLMSHFNISAWKCVRWVPKSLSFTHTAIFWAKTIQLFARRTNVLYLPSTALSVGHPCFGSAQSLRAQHKTTVVKRVKGKNKRLKHKHLQPVLELGKSPLKVPLLKNVSVLHLCMISVVLSMQASDEVLTTFVTLTLLLM